MLLTDFIPTNFMTSKNTTQNIKDVSSEALDWAVIQKDMKKNKLPTNKEFIDKFVKHINDFKE